MDTVSVARELLRRRKLEEQVELSDSLVGMVRQAIAEHRTGYESDEMCFGRLMQYAEYALAQEKKRLAVK